MNEQVGKSQVEEVEEEEEEEFSLSENLVLSTTNTSNESGGNEGKKKRRFKPGKFISKLNLKIKRDDKKLKSDEEVEKVGSSPKLESFRKTFVKRFSRRKNYKVSPMTSVENDTTSKEDVTALNNEMEPREIPQISKSDPNLLGSSVETMVHNKMNEDSLELSKSMQTVDKSVYATHAASSSSSSFKKENRKVQLKITISGKKVEKVNTTSASEITTTIVSENEVDKASPLPQQQQQLSKSRTDIILPSTIRVTSSTDEIFNVMVPRSSGGDGGGHAYSHVLHQAKSISNSPSVPYSTVVKEGLTSVSEREIEKYLVLTSNLNSIISAAKDLDKLNSDAKKHTEISLNQPELKKHEKTAVDPKSNIEKERQLINKSGESEMKKSRIPVNRQRRSPSNDSVDKEASQSTPTVHTQEAHKPYNVNLSSSTENLKAVVVEKAEEKEITTPELKPEDIKFELGTPVRPPKILQPSPIRPIADIVITEPELLTSVKDHESTDDIFHSPKSEPSITISKRDSQTRRKIAYIPELSIYTSEEQELLKSNITANHFESFDVPSLPPDSSIFPVFDESLVRRTSA
jgi:hypothetical protein